MTSLLSKTSCVLLLAALGLNGCATQRTPPPTSGSTPAPDTLPPGYVRSYVVFGERYYVLGSASGFRQDGIASWYGSKFHGRKTANGEKYNMYGISAAHKSLPLGTWVRVTNLDNQRSMDLRINDRGPFVDDRVIDLSFAAAKALGVVGPGTAPVRVVALDDAVSDEGTVRSTSNGDVVTATIDRPAVIESRPAPPEPRPEPIVTAQIPSSQVPNDTSSMPTSVAPPAGQPVDTDFRANGYIQVASFGELANAEKMATQLKQSGFNNVIIQAMSVNSRLVHRVRLGPLLSAAQQQDLLDKLDTIGLRGSRVVTR